MIFFRTIVKQDLLCDDVEFMQTIRLAHCIMIFANTAHTDKIKQRQLRCSQLKRISSGSGLFV